MQSEEFLSSSSSLESDLLSFLLSGRSMWLLDKVVAPGSGCDLNVLHRVERRNLANCRAITPKLIRVNDLWNIVLAEQTGEWSCSRCA